MINFKKFIFFILANLLLFLLLEIILTFFFVMHKANYYGPLARLFVNEKISKKTVMYNTKFSKKTGMLIPGEIKYEDHEHRVNKFGFIGEDVSLENKSGYFL